MAVFDILIPFVLLLGGLVFVHELGHFLMGKLMGVRILTFAIGFGPAIPGLRFQRGETEYVIKLFPLGGYVKFFGDDPTEEVPEAERRGSFNHAPLPRRFLIAFGGPLFNLVLPFLIFLPMYLLQSETRPAQVGSVYADGPAARGGLESGDLVTHMNGEEIADWWEMERVIASHANQPIEVRVRRDGQDVGPLTVTPEETVVRSIKELGWEERKGRIQVTSAALAPFVGVDPGSAAAQAGLRDGDRLVAIEGCARLVETWDDARRCLAEREGQRVRIVAQRSPRELDPLSPSAIRKSLWNPIVASLAIVRGTDGGFSGLRSADLVVAEVDADSPAARELGLLPGDRLLALDDEPLRNWDDLLTKLTKTLDDPHSLRFTTGALGAWLGTLRGDAARPLELLLGVAWPLVQAGRAGEVHERAFRLARQESPTGPRHVFGARHHIDYVSPDPIPRPSRLRYALVRSVEETVDAYKITLLTVAGLFAGNVPVKELGGPILIADLARQSFAAGWERFLTLAVWLSINLGILNLLPVPILDGGHLMFFSLEAIRRKPLSLRARQIASYFGLALIVLLMLTAFKNDIERYWDALLSAVGFG